MSVLATIAQVIAAIATTVAAWAAVRTSRAAKTTADRSDLTSERAAEALSRGTRPDLDVLLSPRGDRAGVEPWPMDLVIRNDAPHEGYLLGARIERTDGPLLRELTGCSITLRASYQIEHVFMGSVPAARSEPRPDERYQSDEPEIACVLTFTDAARLATWRQRSYVHENVGFEERDGQLVPTYRYSAFGRDEPELVAPHPDPPIARGRVRAAVAVLRGRAVIAGTSPP